MPSRNVIKPYVAESYYHVYARGSSNQPVFLDDLDFAYMQGLFARYLSHKPQRDKNGVNYPHYFGRIELLAYCLMNNHIHLLIWQEGPSDISQFMKSVLTSYSRYFNYKHRRSGSLFETRYKASRITNASYLQHISRYIHLNPRYWQRYTSSSFRFYYRTDCPEWLRPNKITDLFRDRTDYVEFLQDYEEKKKVLDEIKHELADY